MKVKSLSRVQLLATPWTAAYQALPSMGFSRQEYWSGSPFPPPGDLPNPGMKLTSLGSPALPGGLFTWIITWEARRLESVKEARKMRQNQSLKGSREHR